MSGSCFRARNWTRCAAASDNLADGYHKAQVYGDTWTFYDLDGFPRLDAGTLEVPYLRVHIPRTFMRAVYRLARKTWRLMKAARDAGASPYERVNEVSIHVTDEHAERVERLYGQGLGFVDLVMQEETRRLLADRLLDETLNLAKMRPNQTRLLDMLTRVQAIARNSTWGRYQTATVRISKDWDGFYWSAHAPNGRQIMNGGIVNHAAREDGHDWSIHT